MSGAGFDLMVVRSDKDTHFTGAIGAGAISTAESITIPDRVTAATFIVRNMALYADENNTFDIVLWTSAGANDADLDLDRFVAQVSPDASPSQIGLGASYYATYSTLDIYLRDESYDSSSDPHTRAQLHASLLQTAGAGKSAGAAGEVVLVAMVQSLR